MTFCRMISPDWAKLTPRVLEGMFTNDQIAQKNAEGYGVYYLPNHPSEYDLSVTVNGSHIDKWDYCFVDMDCKDGKYTKDSFIERLAELDAPPSRIVDSGGGIHAFWQMFDLDAMSYLRFQRRLARLLDTDIATTNIFQLMRLDGTNNTKIKDNPRPCELLHDSFEVYSCEQLDKMLPSITIEDEVYCQQHYNKTYSKRDDLVINDELPAKWGKLLRENQEAKSLWSEVSDDRSKQDFRLGHIMFAAGFTRQEAASVLVNSVKALQRAPIHRISYADNIIDKIWTYEAASDKTSLGLSSSVLDILQRPVKDLEGTRFTCYPYIDNTEAGFRLGNVMGLVAGSGVGKTAMALNIFLGFVANNPDFDHFFCPLEQVDREIAMRWQTMCGENTALHGKVHIISNYDENGTFRDLSLNDIKEHILQFKASTGKNVGCVVIDHIGVLCNNNKLGQDEGVKQICKQMKGFATETNTFLIMQSQTNREKAGIGDLELDKGAAFGTSTFENYTDFLITLWQPLKRQYAAGAPTVMAYKFCKIRHKHQGKDVIQEDVPYYMFFDPATQLLRDLTQDEKTSFKYHIAVATNKRKADRKTEILEYTSVKPAIEENINVKH